MAFKLIDSIQLNKLYPDNYDYIKLKNMGLMDVSLNTNFRFLYSNYRYYLDQFLNQKLNLSEINKYIIDNNIGLNVNFIYKDISNLELDYLFIRNNIFVDRLDSEIIKQFCNSINNNQINTTYNIINNTYKSVISFDGKDTQDEVLYDKNLLDKITHNNALVIGVLLKDEVSNDILEFFKQKEEEYSNILNIPVSIFIYKNTDIINYDIYTVHRIREDNEEELKEHPKFLPIGSVVMLKGATKKMIIVGHLPIDDDETIIGDYIGYIYPEGFISKSFNIIFSHDDIGKIYAIGLKDKEQEEYLNTLK